MAGAGRAACTIATAANCFNFAGCATYDAPRAGRWRKSRSPQGLADNDADLIHPACQIIASAAARNPANRTKRTRAEIVNAGICAADLCPIQKQLDRISRLGDRDVIPSI